MKFLMVEPSQEEKDFYIMEEQLGTIKNARLSLLRDRNNWLSLDIALVEGIDGPSCSFFTVGWNALCDNNNHKFAETLYNIFNTTRVEDIKDIIGKKVKIYYEKGFMLYGFSFCNWETKDTRVDDLCVAFKELGNTINKIVEITKRKD